MTDIHSIRFSAGESSPWLRRRCTDPVHWFTRADRALQAADEGSLPLFLYIDTLGVSDTADQVFTSHETAALLNRSFVPLVLDAAVQPEMTTAYSRAAALMTGSSQLPLTVFALSDGRPFFIGAAADGSAVLTVSGLTALMRSLADKWNTDRDLIYKAADDIASMLTGSRRPPADAVPQPSESAEKQLLSAYDSEYGGFGTDAKLPNTEAMRFLLKQAALSEDRTLRKPVEFTLQQMYRGGFHDHIGGGFFDASADREWLVPFFRKSLAVNALTASLAVEAWQNGHYDLHRRIADDALGFCLQDLSRTDGLFADSIACTDPSHYLFTPAQVADLLGEDDGKYFCECFDITEEGNFSGASLPNLLLNNRWNMLPEGYDRQAALLAEEREKRPGCQTDPSAGVTSNALMLSALSAAYTAFGTPGYGEAAEKLAAALDGLLFADVPAARTDISGRYGTLTLSDCAFAGLAYLDLYDAEFDPACLHKAKELAARIRAHYAAGNGGYYETADTDRLPAALRTEAVYDSSLPCSSGAACRLFGRLARLTQDSELSRAASELTAHLSSMTARSPAGCAGLIQEELLSSVPAACIVCASPDGIPDTLAVVCGGYRPELSLVLKTPENEQALADLLPYTAELAIPESKTAYYVNSGKGFGGPILTDN